jgi:tRNA(Glu) U13 pseudouridine synthase TruD
MDQERRALRLAVRELTWHRDPDANGTDGKPVAANAIVLRFRLTRGSFATTVLRELIASDALDEDDQEGA